MHHYFDNQTARPLAPYLAGCMGLALACGILPFVFAIAGANPDKIGTQIAFWACAVVCAAVAYVIQRPKWRRWAEQRWGT